MPTDSSADTLTTLDWIGVIVAAVMTLALLAFPLAGRTFARMYQDFQKAPLPTLTQWCTSAWFPPLLGGPALAALVAGLRPASPTASRRMGIVLAFLLAGAGIAVCLAGAYLPIFRIAGAIKPD